MLPLLLWTNLFSYLDFTQMHSFPLQQQWYIERCVLNLAVIPILDFMRGYSCLRGESFKYPFTDSRWVTHIKMLPSNTQKGAEKMMSLCLVKSSAKAGPSKLYTSTQSLSKETWGQRASAFKNVQPTGMHSTCFSDWPISCSLSPEMVQEKTESIWRYKKDN